jgi:hypothetical protein
LGGAVTGAAETVRIATWNPDLTRQGPGLLLRDILSGKDEQVLAAVAVIGALDADILLLTGIDHDYEQRALMALADRLAAAGAAYPHVFALPPNTGLATGLDLDGDGRLGEPEDAQGFGRFRGEGGMAVLSRHPIRADAARDFSGFLWGDLPGALLPDGMADEVLAAQRLSTTAHWEVPVALPGGEVIRLLCWYGTPPVFDGPEDRNGRRNHDEAAFWLRLLAGEVPGHDAPGGPVAVMGQANLDVADGEGRAEALRALMAHPAVQDPAPAATWGRADPGQAGDPARDTADYGGTTGALRVDYLLPPAALRVTASGVLRPAADDPLVGTMARASRHFPVWVDLDLP